MIIGYQLDTPSRLIIMNTFARLFSCFVALEIDIFFIHLKRKFDLNGLYPSFQRLKTKYILHNVKEPFIYVVAIVL